MYTLVTEAQKECTCAAYVLANLLQKANSGSKWRLTPEQVGGTKYSFVCHVPYPRDISLGHFTPPKDFLEGPAVDRLRPADLTFDSNWKEQIAK